MFQLLPDGGEGSVACYFPTQHMFVFMFVGVASLKSPGEPPDELPGFRTLFTSDDVPHDKMTMGQALATADLLSGRLVDKPPSKLPDRVGIESTVEIEKELTIA
jgi:hypothetical protein